jgi:hypothetical protein
MASYRCEICGAEFGTPSEYRQHMQTSHPERAPSAADLERALAGVEYPARPGGLAAHAREHGNVEVARILGELKDRPYADAADVARAFGALRSHEEAPADKPSARGGAAAMASPSAARIASLFDGMTFPATAEALTRHARGEARAEEMELIERLPDRRYDDMSDVARAFGEVVRKAGA